MKKIIGGVLFIFLLFIFCSCNSSLSAQPAEPTHRWTKFYYDEISHWRTCWDEGCDAVDRAVHSAQNPVCGRIPRCDICGHRYGEPTPHLYDENENCIRCGERMRGEGLEYHHNDGYYAVSGIGECVYADIEISSVHNGLPVSEICAHAFAEQQTVESIVIPDSVEKIGWGAFSDCENLKSAELSEKLTSIEGYLFNGCRSLAFLQIPEGVTHIGDRAFFHCEALTEIVLPSTLTVLDGTPFLYCHSLRRIVFNGTAAQWDRIEKNGHWISGEVLVICIDGEFTVDLG